MKEIFEAMLEFLASLVTIFATFSQLILIPILLALLLLIILVAILSKLGVNLIEKLRLFHHRPRRPH